MSVRVRRVSRQTIASMGTKSKMAIGKQTKLIDDRDLNFPDMHRQPSLLTIRPVEDSTALSSNNPFVLQQKGIRSKQKLFSNKITNYIPKNIRSEIDFEDTINNDQSIQIRNKHTFRIRDLSLKQKICLLITFLVIVAICCAAILLPIFLLRQNNNLSSSSFANITVLTCSRSTCIGQETPFHTSMTTLSYGFDGNFYDSTGLAGGTPFGVPPSTTFTGQGISGSAYYLISSNSQYISIPYVNLSQQSFTFQIWVAVYSDGVNTDAGIFSQCGSIDNICFSLSVQNYHVVLSFDALNPNDTPLIGSTIIPYYVWTHITIVYDAIALQQLIYVNGRIDAVSNGMVSPYQGTPAGISTTTVGLSSSFAYPSSYFYGFIDQLVISSGTARSACQILNDASLLVYFPFDKDKQLIDYSNYNYYGYTLNTAAFQSGRIQQAILFNSSISYFQSQCLPTTRTTMSFSISLWVYPILATNGGTLVHLSALQNGTGTPCYDLLALTSTGQIVAQLIYSSTNVTDFLGPVLPNNTWTHLTLVYGYTNGMRLFVNGVVKIISRPYASIPVFTYAILFVTLANTNPKGPSYSVNCPSGSSSGYISGPFAGAIDDFRLYSRELDAQEICVLANT